jgi:hypothetical protein
VILRHGGEAQKSRNRFARLSEVDAGELEAFLNPLVLFPPDDMAPTLDPPPAPKFPQTGHGSIKLTVLFSDPAIRSSRLENAVGVSPLFTQRWRRGWISMWPTAVYNGWPPVICWT